MWTDALSGMVGNKITWFTTRVKVARGSCALWQDGLRMAQMILNVITSSYRGHEVQRNNYFLHLKANRLERPSLCSASLIKM